MVARHACVRDAHWTLVHQGSHQVILQYYVRARSVGYRMCISPIYTSFKCPQFLILGRFPPYISPLARSLIQGLLTRNPHHRLGAKGPEEVFIFCKCTRIICSFTVLFTRCQVRGHPFFGTLDWIVLEDKLILWRSVLLCADK